MNFRNSIARLLGRPAPNGHPTLGSLPPSTGSITVNYSDARPGAGKTSWAIDEMVRIPGNYLYVIDRREVLNERQQMIEAAMQRYGMDPVVSAIYSASAELLDGVKDVRRRVRETGVLLGSLDHVIVVITAEAMRSADLSTYAGWTLLIDEVPDIWSHAAVRTPETWKLLSEHYKLEPTAAEGWSMVVVQNADKTPALRDLHDDAFLDDFAAFHLRVAKRGVMANLTTWEEAAATEWHWWSLWQVTELKAFQRVVLVANAVTETLFYHLNREAVQFVPFTIDAPTGTPPYKARVLRLCHFAQNHIARATFFDTPEGERALRLIGDWLRSRVSAVNHYWTCNQKRLTAIGILPGEQITPKSAGLNRLRGCCEGTVLYSAKPSRLECAALDLFGVTSQQITRAREYEDIIQFLWRSSLRVPDDTRTVTLNLYDRAQANFITGYIARTGLPITVETEHVELGVDALKPEKQKPGPKIKTLTPDEIALKNAAKQEANRRHQAAYRARQRAAKAA